MTIYCRVCNSYKDSGRVSRATTCNACLTKGFKWCKGCDKVLPIDKFGKNGTSLKHLCKLCYYANTATFKRTKYNTDEEYKLKELNRQHARRADFNGSYTSNEWYEVLDVFNGTCAYCGSAHYITKDHVVPISMGGTNIIHNIVPACKSCNSSKRDLELVEWYTSKYFYNKERLDKIISWYKGGMC